MRFHSVLIPAIAFADGKAVSHPFVVVYFLLKTGLLLRASIDSFVVPFPVIAAVRLLLLLPLLQLPPLPWI